MTMSKKLLDYEQIRSILPIEDATILYRMNEILSILSKIDALQIFILAKNGLKSELDTPQKVGLTKKQYYTRLKQLHDLGLIAKKGDSYVHTSFGELVYNKHIMGFLHTMSNIKEFEMIDVLKKSSKFNNAEISEFLSRLHPKNSDFITAKKSTVANGFDAMVSKVLEAIEFAQHEILIASRFSNDLIINSTLKKSTVGVKVRILADVNTVRGFFKNSGKEIDKQDKNQAERMEVVANPFYPSNIERRYVHVPFSLIIVDGKDVGMEIVDNYNHDKFMMSVHTEDESLASEMKIGFDKLWSEATLTLPQSVSKIRKS